jgi:phosphoglycolate phosphatase
MKEGFEGLVEHLLDGGLFLQQAIEILEKSMIQGALQHNQGNQCAAASSSEFTATPCSGKWWRTKWRQHTRPRRKPMARAGHTRKRRRPGSRRVDMDLLIFDLDGTLIDSKLDLAHAVNATRSHMGLTPLEHERVYSYVGNGAPVLIRRAMGADASEAEVQEALEFFLEYYREHYLDYTKLYPGVRETLDRLHAAGKRMAVLTNKPVRISRAILDGLGVGGHFFQVYGGNSFDLKKPNPIGVEMLMRETGIRADRTLMIGDSSVDTQTARNAGIASCGVTYGFAPETLSDPVPDRVLDRMEELADWLLGPHGENEPPPRLDRACHRHLLVQRLQDAAAFYRTTGVPTMPESVRAGTVGVGGKRQRRLEESAAA